MKYIKVMWATALPHQPVAMYSELEPDNWEVRKVDEFADGRMYYASEGETYGNTDLSVEPLPSLAKIAENPCFVPLRIDRTEFEAVWREAVSRAQKS